MRKWTGGLLCHAVNGYKKDAEKKGYPFVPLEEDPWYSNGDGYGYIIFPTPQDTHSFRYIKR